MDLVLDQEKTSFELEARIKKQENPFFNEERFLAEKNLAFAQKMAVEKGKNSYSRKRRTACCH